MPEIERLPDALPDILTDTFDLQRDQVAESRELTMGSVDREDALKGYVASLRNDTVEERKFLAHCEAATADNRQEADDLDEVLKDWKAVAVRVDMGKQQCEGQIREAKGIESRAETLAQRWSGAGEGAERVEGMLREAERLDAKMVKLKLQREKFADHAMDIKKQFGQWANFNKQLQSAGMACDLLRKPSPEKLTAKTAASRWKKKAGIAEDAD
jgi:hypothetical protein